MAKISPVSIKYMIHATFEAIGPVEKPDVIGALFGQTEGLLGNDLEIRDLQKEGKIGRIEVETQSSGGKTTGKIDIPTALDKSETSLIAAAIETIDRVGPTEAKITINSIEDVRGNKRDYILERAKKLLEGMEDGNSSKEISQSLRTASRAAKIQEYGDEKLPSGDLSGKEVIVVEGRADVVNLLENRINNVVGMNGTKLPKGIIELSRDKEITLFLDGDRGGKLICKNVMENADVDFIAFAPDGKEVEELSGKEILAALRKKIPAKEFSSSTSYNKYSKSEPKKEINNNKIKIDSYELQESLKQVNNSKKAYLFDKELNIIKKIPTTQASRELSKTHHIAVVAIDGKATATIVRSAIQSGVSYLAAKNFTDTSEEGIEFVSF